MTVANRIERIAADIRRDERQLEQLTAAGSADSDWARAVRDRLAVARADLEHWRGVRSQQLADGTATSYSRDNVQPGDLVKIRGRWHNDSELESVTVSPAARCACTSCHGDLFVQL